MYWSVLYHYPAQSQMIFGRTNALLENKNWKSMFEIVYFLIFFINIW